LKTTFNFGEEGLPLEALPKLSAEARRHHSTTKNEQDQPTDERKR